MQTDNSLEKSLILGKIKGRRRGHQRWEDGMASPNAMNMNLGRTLGVGEGQGGHMYCSPWDPKQLDMSGQLYNNKSPRMITKVLWVLILRIQINFSEWMIFKYRICELWRWNVSVQLSHSVMSDYLRPHGRQHVRIPYPSPTSRACSNACPSSQWCYPTISSSVVPFSSCPQSFPESGSFPLSQFFPSGSQSIGASALASVLPMNIQDWFPLGLTGWISLQTKGLSRVFSNTTDQKHQFFGAQLSLQSNSHIRTWLLTLTRWTFVSKVMSLLFNMLSWSQLFFQGASVFQLHACSHHLKWFWSPRK